VSFKNEFGHLLAVATRNAGQPFIYYQGGAWNRSGFFPDEQSWIDYLADFHKRLKSPLEISY
jgi:hypothetical protein